MFALMFILYLNIVIYLKLYFVVTIYIISILLSNFTKKIFIKHG